MGGLFEHLDLTGEDNAITGGKADAINGVVGCLGGNAERRTESDVAINANAELPVKTINTAGSNTLLEARDRVETDQAFGAGNEEAREDLAIIALAG